MGGALDATRFVAEGFDSSAAKLLFDAPQSDSICLRPARFGGPHGVHMMLVPAANGTSASSAGQNVAASLFDRSNDPSDWLAALSASNSSSTQQQQQQQSQLSPGQRRLAQLLKSRVDAMAFGPASVSQDCLSTLVVDDALLPLPLRTRMTVDPSARATATPAAAGTGMGAAVVPPSDDLMSFAELPAGTPTDAPVPLWGRYSSPEMGAGRVSTIAFGAYARVVGGGGGGGGADSSSGGSSSSGNNNKSVSVFRPLSFVSRHDFIRVFSGTDVPSAAPLAPAPDTLNEFTVGKDATVSNGRVLSPWIRSVFPSQAARSYNQALQGSNLLFQIDAGQPFVGAGAGALKAGGGGDGSPAPTALYEFYPQRSPRVVNCVPGASGKTEHTSKQKTMNAKTKFVRAFLFFRRDL